MEKIWSSKRIKDLTDKEKDNILQKVFDAVVDNEMYEDMGEDISDFLTFNGYVYQVEIED